MKITTRKIYSDEDGNDCWFVKVLGAPGYSHRVVVNDVGCAWLCDTHRPSAQVAGYFLEKYGTNREDVMAECKAEAAAAAARAPKLKLGRRDKS